MRISDWSSDVCSSDLAGIDALLLESAGGARSGSDLRMLIEHGRRLRSLMHYVPRTLDHGLVEALALTGALDPDLESGRASCRERVCQYVYISVVAVTLKKNTTD